MDANKAKNKQPDVLHQDVLQLLKRPRFVGLKIAYVGLAIAAAGFLVAYLGQFSIGYTAILLGWLIGVVGIITHWVKLVGR